MAKTPPSPPSSAWRTNSAYLKLTTSMSDQKISDTRPRTFCGEGMTDDWPRKQTLRVYRGLVPMSPKTDTQRRGDQNTSLLFGMAHEKSFLSRSQTTMLPNRSLPVRGTFPPYLGKLEARRLNKVVDSLLGLRRGLKTGKLKGMHYQAHRIVYRDRFEVQDHVSRRSRPRCRPRRGKAPTFDAPRHPLR